MTARLLLAAVWLLSALYLAKDLRRSWLPHDEGLLAQSAERVLLGELPHKDFDEIYTGGLSCLNAEAFRLFGTNLASMRYMLYPFFVVWVPCVFFIASRFAGPWVAAAFTFLAVAWSVPNYPPAMPSWYNLFFATFGIVALLRYIETGRHRWVFIAGVCGGVSFLFKVSGLYYVAGAVLFLLFRQLWTQRDGATERDSQPQSWYRPVGVVLFVLAYEVMVISLLRKVFYLGSVLYFFLPALAIGIAVVWQELQSRRGAPTLKSLLKDLLLFGTGVAIPVLIFLIPYMRAGAVADFVRGVFVLPGKRFLFAIRTQSVPRFLVGSTVDIACVTALFRTPGKIRGTLGGLLAAAAMVAGIEVKRHLVVYDAVWVPIWNLLPVVVCAGVLFLMTRTNIQGQHRDRVFLLLATTAACNLVQFPYSAQIYFCYVAPLLVLSILAVGTLVDDPPRLALSSLFCICLLYTLFVVTPTFKFNHGEVGAPSSTPPDLAVPRAGSLTVYGEDAKENTDVVNLVLQHARGSYIYATPDCPQVYFLSGFRNPTRTMFDFLDEQTGRTERILNAIHAHAVNLVVINRSPGFSGPVPEDLRAALESEFPEHAATANYEVRWKP